MMEVLSQLIDGTSLVTVYELNKSNGWQTGNCTYGDACKFAHVALAQKQRNRERALKKMERNEEDSDPGPVLAPRRVDLYSAYRDREKVKAAGATWDGNKRLWFVYAGHDLRSVRQVSEHASTIPISRYKTYLLLTCIC